MKSEPKSPSQTLRLYTEDEAGSTVVLEAIPQRRNYDRRFLTMFVTTMETMAQWDRPAAYHRVLWHLITRLDPIQWRITSAAKIAEECGLSSGSVERALAMLAADNVILQKGSRSQRERRLNNNMAWASNVVKFHDTPTDPQPVDARGR